MQTLSLLGTWPRPGDRSHPEQDQGTDLTSPVEMRSPGHLVTNSNPELEGKKKSNMVCTSHVVHTIPTLEHYII